jgi:cell division protein FtsQ
VLRVSHVIVQGAHRISEEDVHRRLDGIRAESILRIDLDSYRDRLLASPWIAGAELWRVLPSTVHVRIVERRPIAIARQRGQLYLVGADGVVMDSVGPQHADLDLPIVDGLLESTPGGLAAASDRIGLVHRLLASLAPRADLLSRLSQVNVSDARNAVVLLDGEAAELRLGDAEFLERIQRYEEMAPVLREQHAVLEYFDLRFGNYVWVK